MNQFKQMCDPQQAFDQKIYSLDKIIEQTYQSFETQFIPILKDMRALKSILKKNEKKLAQMNKQAA